MLYLSYGFLALALLFAIVGVVLGRALNDATEILRATTIKHEELNEILARIFERIPDIPMVKVVTENDEASWRIFKSKIDEFEVHVSRIKSSGQGMRPDVPAMHQSLHALEECMILIRTEERRILS